jgi:pyruvate/2-oxoglutarate dehydrogenase complex dihydrolipoamide dehydrogenase (E3) component
VTPASALHAFGLEVASVGLRLSDAEAAGIGATSVTVEHVSRVGMLPEARPIFVTLVFEQRSGRILGGQLLGEEGAALRANVLVPMIRKRCTLTELAAMDLVYAPPIAPSLDPLYVAARAGLRKQRKG